MVNFLLPEENLELQSELKNNTTTGDKIINQSSDEYKSYGRKENNQSGEDEIPAAKKINVQYAEASSENYFIISKSEEHVELTKKNSNVSVMRTITNIQDFQEGNAYQSAEKRCIKLNTESNQRSEDKKGTMLTENGGLLIVDSCNKTLADNEQKIKIKNKQENICQSLDNCNIHYIDKNSKLQRTGDKCTRTSDMISCVGSQNNTCEVDKSSRHVEEDIRPQEENFEKLLKSNKQPPIEHCNQNSVIEDKNGKQCLEDQTEVKKFSKKVNVAKVKEIISQIVEEIISQHAEKDKEIKDKISHDNYRQFNEESSCKRSSENIHIDLRSGDKPNESRQETIATENTIENSKETKRIKLIVEEMVSGDWRSGLSSIPPLYNPENDPVWKSRVPPPPGCEPEPLTDCQVEYDVSQLPLAVRTYLVWKGITEGEIHEFSGAKVLYRGLSFQSVKPHLVIQGRTQKQLNMATSLVLTLIKEGFEASMDEKMKKEVGMEPSLEINNQAGNNSLYKVQSLSNATEQPVPGEVLSEHFEMEYDINDLPLTVRTHIVLKGVVERRVTRATGASVRTEGSYVVPQNKKYSRKKPLCVFVQAASEESLNLAIKILDELKAEAFRLDGSTVVRKVPVGLESAPIEFDLRNRLLGPNGEHLQYIKNETGATVSLRGQQSGYLEYANQESSEPLHIRVEHMQEDVIEQAQSLVFSLVKTVQDDFVEFSRGILQGADILPYPINIATGQSGPAAFEKAAKIVYEGAPTSYGVPRKPLSCPSPLSESKDPPPPGFESPIQLVPPPLIGPRPQCPPSAVRLGQHQAVELPKKRQLVVDDKPKLPSDQPSSKKLAVSLSSSINSKSSLKKIQFTIINSTKKLPLQNISALNTKKVSVVTTANPEKISEDEKTSCHTKENEANQPIWCLSPKPKKIKRRFSDWPDQDANTQRKGDNKEAIQNNSAALTDLEHNYNQNQKSNEMTQVVELLQSALGVLVASLPAGLEATQLAKVQQLLQRVVPGQTDERAAAEQRSQLRIVLQLLEKYLDNTGDESECKTPLLQTMKLMKKILHTKDAHIAETECQKPSQPCDPSENQKSLQLMQITELLQKALQSYVKKLTDVRQKSHLTPVLQVMQEVMSNISTVATDEQQNQLLTVLDLLEKALQSKSSGGEQQPLQLLQIMQILKKVLQKDANSKSQVQAQTQSALIVKPSLASLPPDQPSHLVQLLQLMISVMQSHINIVGMGPQKNQLLQIMQLLEHTFITRGMNLETEDQKTQLLMILQLVETAVQSSEQQPLELLQIMQLIRTALQAQASTAVAVSHPTQLIEVMDTVEKTLQTHAISMEMSQQKLQLLQVITMLQQALANKPVVTAPEDKLKTLIQIMQLVQQILQTQVFPPSAGTQPTEILKVMQLIQKALNTVTISQPAVNPFSIPPPPLQFSQIAQKTNIIIQNHFEMNQLQLVQPDTLQFQPNFAGLINSLPTQANIYNMQLGSNSQAQAMQQIHGLQNQFSLNIPGENRLLPMPSNMQQLQQLQMSNLLQQIRPTR